MSACKEANSAWSADQRLGHCKSKGRACGKRAGLAKLSASILYETMLTSSGELLWRGCGRCTRRTCFFAFCPVRTHWFFPLSLGLLTLRTKCHRSHVDKAMMPARCIAARCNSSYISAWCVSSGSKKQSHAGKEGKASTRGKGILRICTDTVVAAMPHVQHSGNAPAMGDPACMWLLQHADWSVRLDQLTWQWIHASAAGPFAE